MEVMLSIKPKYVKAIFEGRKKFEFRKTIFRKYPIDRVFIYSSAPVKQLVASFTIGTILEDHPVKLWNRVRAYAGIDDADFFSYFTGKSWGYAIGISHLQEFNEPIDPKSVIPGFVPPQSYSYIKDFNPRLSLFS